MRRGGQKHVLDPNFEDSYVDTMSTNLSKNTHTINIVFDIKHILFSFSDCELFEMSTGGNRTNKLLTE